MVQKAYLKAHDQRLPLNVRERQVHVAHITLVCVLRPVEHNTITLGGDAVLQPLSHCCDVGCV